MNTCVCNLTLLTINFFADFNALFVRFKQKRKKKKKIDSFFALQLEAIITQ